MDNLDERLDKLTRGIEMLLQSGAQHDAKIGKLEELVTGIAEGTARLLRVVEMPEHRLDSQDDRLDNLENT